MIRRVVVAFTFAVRLRSRAKALHPDVRNTPDPLYISYIDFSISDTYSEFTKGMEPRLVRASGPLGDTFAIRSQTVRNPNPP